MMNQYSQIHLKVAATESEHIVRKAEFDIAVQSLDERIVVIEQKTFDGRPTVLQTTQPSENIMASDALGSPQTNPVTETVSIMEDAVGIKPSMSLDFLPSETVATADAVESPMTTPLVETTTAMDMLETKVQAMNGSENETEKISAADTVSAFTGKPLMKNMENSQIQGQIEVIVEDKNGNVKSRQEITNAITDGFLRYAFYDMLNGGTLGDVLRSKTRTGYNLLSRAVPSALGIYAMNRNIDVGNETFLPPYVIGDLATLDPGVVFYNIGGSATEDSQVMIPVDQRCFFDHSSRELIVEYVKNTGYGVVKSVCVGRSHLQKTQMYSVTQTETAVPNQWSSTSTSYLIEHHATTGTSLWKATGTTAQYRFNLKDRTADSFANAALNTNITTATTVGGLVVGNHLFKAVRQTVTGSSYTLRLNYVMNFRTASNVATRDIVLTTREGMSVATDTMPVMVYRSDTDKLEIFVTVSSGDHDGDVGFNVYKVIVSGLNSPTTMTTETVDLGILPYCISNFETTAALYLTGYFDGTSYYLPYTSVYDATNRIRTVAENAFQNGIVIAEDFETISRVINMRNSTSGPNLIVRADTGLLQCQANAANIPYIFMSQVVSGANLPQASVKELDDVLRIIYKYKLT